MRIMLDTNIFVSALVFSSLDMMHVINVAATENELILSSVGKDELFDVIERKFPDKWNAVERLLSAIPHILIETPIISSSNYFTVRDANDYPILNSAIACDVDAFVSGGQGLLGGCNRVSQDIEALGVVRASEWSVK
jgi:putative PIN family toxin of toxin-antitoxin system